MKVGVLGGATTRFGELWHVSPRELVREAVFAALQSSGLKISDLEAIFVGNMLSGILGGQEHLGAFFSEELGVNIPSVKVEGACASGGLAVHTGVQAVLSQIYRTVLVIGVEKMTDFKPEEVAVALMGAGSAGEREAGATFPALYALMTRAHMEKYGTTEEDLAAVAVKNHYHASLNPLAQFHAQITVEQVLKSSLVASPLKLLDCSPVSDGAGAVILSVDKKLIGKIKKPVFITASAVATDSIGLAKRESLTGLKATVEAGKIAFRQAGLKPEDVDVCEVHDCFTIAEIMAMEDLGFWPKGKAAPAISSGKTRLGSKLAVNTSGGLKACGHPVGATGVKQVVEIYQQLAGLAGKRQVENARIGLTHNVGGSGGTAVVHLLQNL